MPALPPGLARLREVVDVILDGFAAIALLLAGAMMWNVNPYLAAAMFLSIIDQVDDVHFALYKKHIYPERLIFRICNFIFEFICLVVAFGLWIFTGIYMLYFPVPWWYILHTLAFALMYSTGRDLIESFVFKKRRMTLIGRAPYFA